MEFRRATKDHYEQETDEAERLVRPAPKVKPKRTDLRREEMQTDRDPDTDTDPDTKRDPDVSLNYKSVGGSQRVVARFLRADLDRKDLVKVRKKDTGNVTYVTKKRLQEEGGDYDVVEDEEEGKVPDDAPPDNGPPEAKGPSEDAPDRVDAVKALNHEMQMNQSFGQALKKMLGPRGDLSGLPQEYPVAKIKGLAQHPVLKQFETLGDIREALLDTPHVSKPQKGTPKNKPEAQKEAPEAPKDEPVAPKEAPKDTPPETPPEGTGAPKPESNETSPPQGEEDTPSPKDGEDSKEEDSKEDDDDSKEDEDLKEEDSEEKKPKGKGNGKKKPEFPRREFSQGEADRAKIQLITTFPPDVARNLLRQDLHPDDVTELMSAYHTAKTANPKTMGDALEMVGGGKAYQTDPAKITRSPRFGQDSTGAEMPFEALTPAEQHLATQKYRMQLAATSLAARSAVIDRLKAKAGDVPEELLSRIADFGLSKPEGETPEQRVERAQKASKAVFAQTLAAGFAYENRADNSRWESQRNDAIQEHENAAKEKGEEYDPDLDPDLPPIPPGEHKGVSEAQIARLLSSLEEDSGAQQIAVGFLQAADYMDAQERFLNTSASSEAMTEHQSPKKIWSGVQKAMGFFRSQAKRYPKELSWANDPAASFRHRVLDKVRTLAPEKYPALQEWNDEYEDEDYEHKQKEWDKSFSEKAPYREQGVKPPPRPMEPPGYAERHGEKRSKSQSRKLLKDLQRQWGEDEGTKTASSVVLRFLRYSSYPLGVTMGSSADNASKTAVYWGVQPYPKGHEGFAPYTKWTQVHQRDLTETDYSGIVSSAREWLKMPVLSADVDGIVRDTQLRAALDLAIRTHGDGKYSVGLQPPVYNRLLAKLAGKPEDETLLTVQAAVRASLSKKACGGSCGGCASCGNASENHVSVYAPTGEEPPMKASAQVRKFAAQVASTNPTVAYELIDLATKLAQQEDEGQQAAQDQKQGGEVPPQFLEHMKKKEDDKGDDKKEDDKKEAKQAAYTELRSHVIRQAHANPHIREAYQPLLETIKRLG